MGKLGASEGLPRMQTAARISEKAALTILQSFQREALSFPGAYDTLFAMNSWVFGLVAGGLIFPRKATKRKATRSGRDSFETRPIFKKERVHHYV
jgi:hypothetical protein